MPSENKAMALRPEPAAPREDLYQALCTALSSNARGRWFLAEYARRNGQADTATLRDALARLEAHLRADAAAAERLRNDLRMLLIAIRLARPQIDANDVQGRAVQLAALLDMLERRIDHLAEAEPAPHGSDAETARARLAVVPSPDEPELPIPTPAAMQEPQIVLVGTAALMPSPFDGAPATALPEQTPPPVAEAAMAEPAMPKPAAAIVVAPVAEKATPAPAAEPVAEEKLWALSAAKLAPPPSDPLAAIMALSEDERIALFT